MPYRPASYPLSPPDRNTSCFPPRIERVYSADMSQRPLTASRLTARVASLRSLLSPCRVCPWECGADRLGGERGRCRSGLVPRVASITLHHGEEPPISGERGSGTVFFSNCTLSCRFCQNYPISQLGHGREMTVSALAESLLSLQERGAHNINFVTPTHYVPQMAEAVAAARCGGLTLPVVYNTSGYERVETLRLLEGIVDVYLPDMKYGDDREALRYSGARGYVRVNRAAVEEMHRQAGGLLLDEGGIARRGVIVRHLVLPGGVSGTRSVLTHIAGTLPGVPVSIMGQYFPAYRAVDLTGLNRRITYEEYQQALELLDELGVSEGWVQSLEE
jgi:putative pyruvate formate lyase activating enzyme